MMTDTLWLADFLRAAVPAFYLLAALYLGVFGGGRAKVKYILIFGATGAGGYMLLNEPSWWFLPQWITADHWWVIALVGVLIAGVRLFVSAIDSSPSIKWPWERGKDFVYWVYGLFTTGCRVVKASLGRDDDSEE